MKRTHVNFLIDAIAFAAFVVLLSTGLLLRYQLPPGSGGVQSMGTGRGAGERPVTLLWGWTRHEWGQFHYWVAGALIAVLAVHLILHWNWIACVVRGKRGEASGLRFGLGLASAVALFALAAMPLLAPTERVTRQELQQQRSMSESNGTPYAGVNLRGSMTVGEVADAANISVDDLIGRLNLPDDVSADQQIGPLLRRHGLRMSDLRQALEGASSNREHNESIR